jgi:hypothetical protein
MVATPEETDITKPVWLRTALLEASARAWPGRNLRAPVEGMGHSRPSTQKRFKLRWPEPAITEVEPLSVGGPRPRSS